MKCHLCGRGMSELPDGIYFRRVNEKGVPGIWECAPACDSPLPSQEAAVLAAMQENERGKRYGKFLGHAEVTQSLKDLIRGEPPGRVTTTWRTDATDSEGKRR